MSAFSTDSFDANAFSSGAFSLSAGAVVVYTGSFDPSGFSTDAFSIAAFDFGVHDDGSSGGAVGVAGRGHRRRAVIAALFGRRLK